MAEIQKRLQDVSPNSVQKAIYKMANNDTISKEGADKARVYFVVQKKQIKSKLKNKNHK